MRLELPTHLSAHKVSPVLRAALDSRVPKITFVTAPKTMIFPTGVTQLAAVLTKLQQDGVTIGFDFSADELVGMDLDRAGLLEVLDLPRFAGGGRNYRPIVPVSSLGEGWEHTVRRVLKMVAAQPGAEASAIRAMEWVLLECVENIQKHSDTPWPAFLFAEASKQGVEVVICDGGQGLKSALGMDDTQAAIEHALGLGRGLHFMKEVLHANQGKFCVWTGDLRYKERGKSTVFFEEMEPTLGVGFELKIKYKNPIDIDKILGSRAACHHLPPLTQVDPTLVPFRTVGQRLLWAYANLCMAHAAFSKGGTTYTDRDFGLRNYMWRKFKTREYNPRSLARDEKVKMKRALNCEYCGAGENLSADHLVPTSKGGPDTGDNLVRACRSCNSSKNNRDLFVWYASKAKFPPLLLARRYLKLCIKITEEAGELDTALVEYDGGLPFDLEAVPIAFPEPADLTLEVEFEVVNPHMDALKTALETIAEARGLTLEDTDRERILSCSDEFTMRRWVGSAALAHNTHEIFAA